MVKAELPDSPIRQISEETPSSKLSWAPGEFQGLSVPEEELGTNPAIDDVNVPPSQSLTTSSFPSPSRSHFTFFRTLFFLQRPKSCLPAPQPGSSHFRPHLAPQLPRPASPWLGPAPNFKRRGQNLQARPVQTRAAASPFPLEAPRESGLPPPTYPARPGGRPGAARLEGRPRGAGCRRAPEARVEQREGASSGRRAGGGAHESLLTGGGFKNAADLNAGWTPAGLGMRAACSPPCRERFWPGKCSTLLLGEAACPPVLHGAGLSQGKGLELGGPQCL